MITPQLLTYISQQLEAGKTKEEIRFTLLQGGGWKFTDVDEAFFALEHTLVSARRSRRSSPLLIVILVALMLGGAGAYTAQKFNIQSYQEAVELIKSFIGKQKAETPLMNSQESVASTTKHFNTYRSE